MDIINPAYFIRSGRKTLHYQTDHEIISGISSLIEKASNSSFSSTNVSIKRHPQLNKDGTVNRNSSLNYTLVGPQLTFREIRRYFANSCYNTMFGYPGDVDFNLGMDRFGGTTPDLRDFHDRLKLAYGLTSVEGIPVCCDIYKKKTGILERGFPGMLRVSEKIMHTDQTIQRAKGFLSFLPAPASSSSTLYKPYDARFESKLQAFNAAYLLVHKEPLYERITGNVVRVRDLTEEYGKRFLSLDRFKTTCFYCDHPITVEDVSIDLDYVHGYCGCDTSKSCFRWPGEDMLRYRTNEHVRACLFEGEKPFGKFRTANADHLIRMIPPVRVDNDSPLYFMNSAATAFMAEEQYERREKMEKYRTLAKIIKCRKQNLNTPKSPQPKSKEAKEKEDAPKPMSAEEDYGGKYDYYYLKVEVDRGEFWNETQMMNVSNIKLRELDNGRIKDKIYGRAMKNKRVAHGSWVNGYTKQDESGKLFRFVLSVRVSKKGGHINFEKGTELEAIPIVAQYRKKTLKKLGNRWQRYFTRIKIQTLLADTIFMKTDLLPPSVAVCTKLVTFAAKLDVPSSSKLSSWNPDMNKVYVGFTARLGIRYFRNGELAVEEMEVTGRITSVQHDNFGENGQQVSVVAVFPLDTFCFSQIEDATISASPIKIRFWEDVSLSEDEVAALPCGIPAGAEGTLKTAEDYEDEEEDFYDDFKEESMANSWLARCDDPDVDTSNINGEEAFRTYKSQKVVDFEKSCPIVNVRKYTRFRLGPMGDTPTKLYRQMRWEKGDSVFPFLRFLLKEDAENPRRNLHVKDLNQKVLTDHDRDLIQKLLEGMNSAQLEGERKMDHQALSFVVGPPGTGKTKFGSRAVAKKGLEENGQCYVLSSSNQACDEFYNYLSKLKESLNLPLNIVRMLSRKKERKARKGFNYLHDMVAEDVKNWSPELQNAFRVSKRQGDARVDPRTRMRLVAQISKSSVAALKKVDIIVCTVACATDNRLNGLINLCRKSKIRPSLVVIDECSRITLTDVMPIMAMDPVRIMLLGDDRQLPPILHNKEASLACLDVSWMRFIRTLPYYDQVTTLLNETYRLTPEICTLISETMYEGKLIPARQVLQRDAKEKVQQLHNRIRAVFDQNDDPRKSIRLCTYKGPREMTKDGQPSKWNPYEVQQVLAIVENLVERCGVAQSQIMVIAMYSKQVGFIQDQLYDENYPEVTVCTVDGSQGMQADIVILSQVRSHRDNHIGFLDNLPRFNVALSRPKHFLFWLMDYECFKKSERASSELYTKTLDKMKITPQPLHVPFLF